MPDERTRALRRRLARRSQLVKARTRAKNEVHGALIRRLVAKPKVSDLFGVAGRRWLEGLELPDEERETVASALRQVDFLESELEEAERVIATDALSPGFGPARYALVEAAWSHLEREQAEGKSRKEALRCLKRHLTRRVWKLLHSSPPPTVRSASNPAAHRTGSSAAIVGTAPTHMPCLT